MLLELLPGLGITEEVGSRGQGHPWVRAMSLEQQKAGGHERRHSQVNRGKRGTAPRIASRSLVCKWLFIRSGSAGGVATWAERES